MRAIINLSRYRLLAQVTTADDHAPWPPSCAGANAPD